jgi:hypothetical protein
MKTSHIACKRRHRPPTRRRRTSAPPSYQATADIDNVIAKGSATLYDVLLQHFGILGESHKGPRSTGPSAAETKAAADMAALKKEAKRLWSIRASVIGSGNLTSYARVIRLDQKLKEVQRKLKKQRRASDAQRSFKHDPHQYASTVFNPRNEAKPTFSKEDCEAHFRATYSDPNRSEPYEEAPPELNRPAPPKYPFDLAQPTAEDVRRVTWRKPNRSSAGVDKIPYTAYKRMTSALTALTTVVQRVWRDRKVPQAWSIAELTLIAKTDKLNDPSQFRPIALLNTGGKIFWSIVNHRLERYMVSNRYVNMSVQKAFLSGMPGCIEHVSRLEEALRVAHEEKRSICVLFTDLANAYGSMKHNHLQYAANWYHVPDEMQELMFNYYEHQFARVRTERFVSDWFQMAIGAFQGCTGSTGFFTCAFNLLLEVFRLPKYSSLGFRVDATSETLVDPAYADDVSLVSQSPSGCQVLGTAFEAGLAWSKTMKLKREKCRSIAFNYFPQRKGNRYKLSQPHSHYSAYDPLLTTSTGPVKYVGDDAQPFKFLGKLVAIDGSDTVARERMAERLTKLLEVVDGQALRGWQKAWLFNFYVATKMSWYLMMYDIPLTVLSALEAKCTKYLKRWLGLQQTSTREYLYMSRKKHGFQLHSLVSLYKRLQLTRYHLLKHSPDKQTQALFARERQREQKQKRKWKAVQTMERHEAVLLHEEQLNQQARKRGGLGYEAAKCSGPDASTTHGLRKLISQRQAAEDDAKRLAHLRTLQMSGLWAEWDHVRARDLSWTRLFQGAISDSLLKFVQNAQQLTVPTDDRLQKWAGVRDLGLRCTLTWVSKESGEKRTCNVASPCLKHTLSSCKAALEQGRLTWRHNSILLIIKQLLIGRITAINRGDWKPRRQSPLRFVSETGEAWMGGKEVVELRSSTLAGLLSEGATDWKVRFDLGKDGYAYSVFPSIMAASALRPDVLLWSEWKKVVVMLELTVPWETNMERAFVRKSGRYEQLATDARENGWRVGVYPVEVGVLGFVGNRMWNMLKAVGLSKKDCLAVKKQMEDVAARCSYDIYLHRKIDEWPVDRPLMPIGVPIAQEGRLESEARGERG